MVGADRFDESAGERGTPVAPAADGGLRTVPDAPPAGSSYWSNIDYPEPRPRPARAPAPTAGDGPQSSARVRLGALLAALIVVGGAAYAVGHANGHAPVPGLHRRVDAQHAQLQARAATIAAQARKLAADEARLRALRSQVSQSAAVQTACRNAITAADTAFGTESDVLHALAEADDASAASLTDRFGTELDDYSSARATCLGSPTSI